MSLQDTVLAMTVMVSEAARLGSDAIVDELVASGLTPEEAQTAVNDVIYVKLGPAYRKAKVQQLHDAGMTQRQIAAEIGVSHTTIQRDLGTDVPAGEPDRAQNGTPFGTDEPEREGVPRTKSRVTSKRVRNSPRWRGQFSHWCRHVLPEDRVYLIPMSRDFHKALDLLGLSCDTKESDAK